MASRFSRPAPPPEKLSLPEAKARTVLERMRDGDPLSEAVWRRPKGDLPLRLRTLSDAATTDCYAAALKYFDDQGIDLEKYGPYVADAFEDEVKLQILFRACRDPEDPGKTFAVDQADLRENTTPVERAVMMLRYNDHVKAVDPNIGGLTPEVNAAIRDLVKKKDATALNAYGSFVLVNYMLSIDEESSSSPTTSADTSP